jgi:XTP/dITP diphosphohydrolase
MTIYACSSNPGKLKEIALAGRESGPPGVSVEVLPALKSIPAPEENGKTFEENARAKALYYSQFTSEAVLADDSGLEVDWLHGAPGVYSARYAGPDATDSANNELLVRNLKNATDRTGRFVCVVALAQQNRLLHSARASVEGVILASARGTGGFGYDPLFFYLPFNRTFAELTPEEKLSVSHRGKALRLLFEWLRGNQDQIQTYALG